MFVDDDVGIDVDISPLPSPPLPSTHPHTPSPSPAAPGRKRVVESASKKHGGDISSIHFNKTRRTRRCMSMCRSDGGKRRRRSIGFGGAGEAGGDD